MEVLKKEKESETLPSFNTKFTRLLYIHKNPSPI